MRQNYWTCSKFADWVRGTAKPGAATSKGWREWKQESKSKHPFRYWLADEALGTLQDIWMWIPDKINDVRYYINNRWVNQTHGMYAKSLKKGQWHEFETRLLHSAFDQLVDFVEVEQAWHHVMWSEEARERFNTPWWRKQWWSRWGMTWRCPDAGIEYLIWASGLVQNEFIDKDHKDYGKPTQQAVTAKETLELYKWWKVTRPARPDPMDASGWSAVCEKRRQKYNDDVMWEDNNKEERKESRKALLLSHKIEEQYDKEDEQMLIRLIKIRKGLWT
jgi:hypothetical protein